MQMEEKHSKNSFILISQNIRLLIIFVKQWINLILTQPIKISKLLDETL